MNTLRIVEGSTVSIPRSELEVLELKGRERNMFRNNLEFAYAKLNRQGLEMNRLNGTVGELQGAVADLREENRDIRMDMENLKKRNHAGDIKQMMMSMKSLIYGEKRRLLGGEVSESKRTKMVMSMYESPGAAIEAGDNLVYLFMKCQEASWANDVPEVIRYAHLVKATIQNQREYEFGKKVGFGIKAEPPHPTWNKWRKRHEHKWEGRLDGYDCGRADVPNADIRYWRIKLRRTPRSL